MLERHQQSRRRSARSRCSATGPTASRAASCRRRRRARRAPSATSSSRSGTGPIPKAYLHDEIATDRRNPSVNANGPIYGSLEASADYSPVLDPMRHQTSRIPIPVRDPNTPYAAPQMVQARLAVLGRGADLDQQGQRAQPDARSSRPPVADLQGASQREPGDVPRGLEPSVREAHAGATPPGVTWRCMTRRPRRRRSSGPASARTTCSSPRMRTTRCGRAAAAVAASSAG